MKADTHKCMVTIAKKLARVGGCTQASIADEMGVSQSIIASLIRNHAAMLMMKYEGNISIPQLRLRACAWLNKYEHASPETVPSVASASTLRARRAINNHKPKPATAQTPQAEPIAGQKHRKEKNQKCLYYIPHKRRVCGHATGGEDYCQNCAPKTMPDGGAVYSSILAQRYG